MLNFLKNFTVAGLLKLTFALLIITTGLMDRETYIVVLGVLLIVLTFASKGSCSAVACRRSQQKK